MLPAAVEILLAAGSCERARCRRGVAEIKRAIGTRSSRLRPPTPRVRCSGEDDIAGASTSLRQACDIWRDLEMPYEEAQTCLLLAAICERRDDKDGRRLELDNARRLFKQLNAEPCLARLTAQADRGTRRSIGSLSEREVQVLRLLAAGKTNRDIAGELFISEKTVARHVSNIFDKVGVSSRAGATAWAYQHNLI